MSTTVDFPVTSPQPPSADILAQRRARVVSVPVPVPVTASHVLPTLGAQKVSRRATPEEVSADLAAQGVRSLGEQAVFLALRSAPARTTAEIARRASLPEPAVTKIVREMQERRVIRCTTSGLGGTTFEIAP